MNGKLAPLVFLDVETTGLDPIAHRVWEIGLIRRDSSGEMQYEYHAFVDMLDLNWPTANRRALDVGRFDERYVPYMSKPERQIVAELVEWVTGAIIVGANPWFDTDFLSAMLRRQGIARCAPWDYHLLNVTDYAAGAIGAEPPYGLDDVLQAYDITYPPAQRHTAFGDARIERDLYDAVCRLRVPGKKQRG